MKMHFKKYFSSKNSIVFSCLHYYPHSMLHATDTNAHFLFSEKKTSRGGDSGQGGGGGGWRREK